MPAPTFRDRSQEVSRLEAFSDAAMGFALTLLVVSLQVPRDADHLFEALKGAPIFAICFAVLLSVWWEHHRFFRRYGLNDIPVFILNGVLLFLVLLYIYPLKFILSLVLKQFADPGITSPPASWQIRALVVLYAGGYAAVSIVFGLLHLYAWRQREQLRLNRVERLMTLEVIAQQTGKAAVCLLSCLVAILVPVTSIAWAGWTLFLLAVPLTTIGTLFGRRIRQIAAAEERAAPAATHG
jgi:uncharacterized membrane protein